MSLRRENKLSKSFGGFLLKLAFPAAGFLILAVSLPLAVFCRIRKKKIKTTLIFAVIGLTYLFPILLTLNIIPVAYPANLQRTEPMVTVCSPFTEEAEVAWGGDQIAGNLPHAQWGSERWAYDLVMEPYDIGSSNLTDYGIFDKEVVSPVAGVVIAVHNTDEDIVPNTEDFQSLEGNYVYIEIDQTGTYLLLNHLRKGSVVVNVGDQVKPGDYLGRVGNSGTSSEPHLHIHHQRQNPTEVLYPMFAEGLPLYFDQDGGSVMPVRGDGLLP